MPWSQSETETGPAGGINWPAGLETTRRPPADIAKRHFDESASSPALHAHTRSLRDICVNVLLTAEYGRPDQHASRQASMMRRLSAWGGVERESCSIQPVLCEARGGEIEHWSNPLPLLSLAARSFLGQGSRGLSKSAAACAKHAALVTARRADCIMLRAG